MKEIILSALIGLSSSLVVAQELSGNMVGSLATSENLLELWVVDGESKYVVKDKNGKALSAYISNSQLAAKYPSLSKLVEEGVADHALLGPAIRTVPGLP